MILSEYREVNVLLRYYVIDTKSSYVKNLASSQRAKLSTQVFLPGDDPDSSTVIGNTCQCQVREQRPRCHSARPMASWQ